MGAHIYGQSERYKGILVSGPQPAGLRINLKGYAIYIFIVKKICIGNERPPLPLPSHPLVASDEPAEGPGLGSQEKRLAVLDPPAKLI